VVPVCIGIYLKSVLRYRLLILDICRPDSLYLHGHLLHGDGEGCYLIKKITKYVTFFETLLLHGNCYCEINGKFIYIF